MGSVPLRSQIGGRIRVLSPHWAGLVAGGGRAEGAEAGTFSHIPSPLGAGGALTYGAEGAQVGDMTKCSTLDAEGNIWSCPLPLSPQAPAPKAPRTEHLVMSSPP